MRTLFLFRLGRGIESSTAGHRGDMGKDHHNSREEPIFTEERGHLDCPGVERLILGANAMETVKFGVKDEVLTEAS